MRQKFFFTMGMIIFSGLVWGEEVNLADLGKDLSLEERKEVLKGKMVFRKIPLSGMPWPQVKLFTLVNVSPLEAMAIYADFEHQKDYVPDMMRSEVIDYKSPQEVIVEYEMDLPWPLANLKYSTIHKLEKPLDDVEGYILSWEQVQSSGTLHSQGRIIFAPWENKVLAVYTNWVEPNSLFAPLLKSQFLSDVQNSFRIILDYIEAIKRKDPSRLERQKKKTLAILRGELVYKELVEKRKRESHE